MQHTRFIGLDVHKERNSVAAAESGRSGTVEYLGEIANEPGARSASCATALDGPASRWCFVSRPDLAAMASIASSPAWAISATSWRRR